MNEENAHIQNIVAALSPEFFYTPKDDYFDADLVFVDFNQIDGNLVGDYKFSSEYYFPTKIIIEVRKALAAIDVTINQMFGFGTLVCVTHHLHQRITSMQSSRHITHKQSFEKEKVQLQKILSLVEEADANFLSLNIKIDSPTTENDAIIKDSDVLEYFKQLLVIAIKRTNIDGTLGSIVKYNLNAITTLPDSRARTTVLPFTKEDFAPYYTVVQKLLETSGSKCCKFLSHVFIGMQTIDLEMLEQGFDGQETHMDIESYLQEKIKKKMV